MNLRTARVIGWMIVALVALPAWAAPDAPVAHPQAGSVRGAWVDGIAAFRGIPYAAAPAGEFRWRPPRPYPTWRETRDASRYGPVCPQNGPLVKSVPGIAMDEDCLRLNLWVEAEALGPGAAPRPVMVWIHGGSFRWGAGTVPGEDPLAFAREGVVIVTFNYRLDRFGLLAHPALTSTAEAEPLANYGLMDMVAALRWVRDNVAAFGGDPGNVTVFGQSAGGVSVTFLMTIPDAAGLFHRAIAQSGSARVQGDRPIRGQSGFYTSLEDEGMAFAGSFGIEGTSGEAATGLRMLTVEQILGYSAREIPNSMNPVVDGRFVPRDVGRSFREGLQHRVPMIAGSTDWEYGLVARYGFPLQQLMPGVDVESARRAYGNAGDEELKRRWFTNATFFAPARFYVAELARRGVPSWLYRYDHVYEAKRGQVPGATHSDELPLLFDEAAPPWLGVELSAADREVGRRMRGLWVQFARTGDPNGPGLPAWPRYSRRDDRMLVIDAAFEARSVGDTAALEFHQRLYEAALADVGALGEVDFVMKSGRVFKRDGEVVAGP